MPPHRQIGAAEQALANADTIGVPSEELSLRFEGNLEAAKDPSASYRRSGGASARPT